MRRLLRWLPVALGGLALYRLLSRRRSRGFLGPSPEELELPVIDRRAEELRRKLEESRALVEEREAFEEGETAVDRADPGESPEERRRRVHERGRAAADEMKENPPV